MLQAFLTLSQADAGYGEDQKRHEAITPPTRPDSNPTNHTTVSKNSSQSSGNLKGTRLRSISVTGFCLSSKPFFFSALRPGSKSIIFCDIALSLTRFGPGCSRLINLFVLAVSSMNTINVV